MSTMTSRRTETPPNRARVTRSTLRRQSLLINVPIPYIGSQPTVSKAENHNSTQSPRRARKRLFEHESPKELRERVLNPQKGKLAPCTVLIGAAAAVEAETADLLLSDDALTIQTQAKRCKTATPTKKNQRAQEEAKQKSPLRQPKPPTPKLIAPEQTLIKLREAAREENMVHLTEQELIAKMRAIVDDADIVDTYPFWFEPAQDTLCMGAGLECDSPLAQRVKFAFGELLKQIRANKAVKASELYRYMDFWRQAYNVLQLRDMCMNEVLYLNSKSID